MGRSVKGFQFRLFGNRRSYVAIGRGSGCVANLR
jgi:hypothetical protein